MRVGLPGAFEIASHPAMAANFFWTGSDLELNGLAKFGVVANDSNDGLGPVHARSRIVQVDIVVVVGEEISARGFGGDEGGADFVAIDEQFYQLGDWGFEKSLSGVFPGAADAEG